MLILFIYYFFSAHHQLLNQKICGQNLGARDLDGEVFVTLSSLTSNRN